MWKHDIPEDVSQVLETSSVLAVSEFQVFRLAYASWYGRDGDEKTLERHFAPYMFGERVPPWVRSFTRRVLDLERRGRLEPDALGVEIPRRDPRDVALGSLYSFAVALSVVALYVFIRLGFYSY